MPQNPVRPVEADALLLNPPNLFMCYYQMVSMSKGRGNDDNRTNRPSLQLQISPRWRKLLGMTGIKKITLLRYLFTCWYRRALTWAEIALLQEILDDFSKSDSSLFIFNRLTRYNPILGTTYLQWCENGWRGKFAKIPYPLELEDVRFHLELVARRLLFSQRAFKGIVLNRFFLKKLGYLVVPHRSESLGIKVRRRRKRGHTDHGSLPSNQMARAADREGAELELRSDLNRLITWLRNLLPP